MADPTNANPIILSTPERKFGLDEKAYRYQLKGIDPDGDTLSYRLLTSPLGALLNSETGELLWFPEADVTTGYQANFQVEVSDAKGGKDIQTFTVDTYSALGKITGSVFEDLNNNGFRDTKLIKGTDPAIVLAIDVSGSTAAPFYGTGEYENVKTVLDAQKAAALSLIDTIIAQGAGNKVKIGIIAHEYNARIEDMNPATPGVETYTTALADNNNNGIADIREILKAYTPNGNNRFTEALNQMDVLIDGFAGTPNLIFMSDGYSRDSATDLENAGNALRGKITTKGGNLTAFAIGEASTLETMQKIDPDATRLINIDELVDIFNGFDERYALEPFKENVTVYLDTNNNGVLDADEPSQITRTDTTFNTLGATKYQYTFDHLLPGTYTVRTVVPNGYTVTTNNGDSYVDTITVKGENSTHLSGLGKISSPPNSAPEFTTVPAALYNIKAGEVLKYDAHAIDPDADAVKYDLLLAPPGMSVEASTGTVVWNPTNKQVEDYYAQLRANLARLNDFQRASATKTVQFNVLLRATDGNGGTALQYVNVELVPDNKAPVFTSLFPDTARPQVGKLFQYQA